MEVSGLKEFISRYAVDILLDNGITSLFPPQEDAVNSGLFTDRNMVIAIPTASGKTLLAELAMLREVIKGGKCLYTAPLRALAMEKYHDFKKWEKIGVNTGISMGDYESKDEWLGENDIIVTTSEKADSLLRNRSSWLKELTCLVVDEIHLLDSSKRGATLEVLITKLRKTNPGIRIIGLSATIPNADEIGIWLDATVVKSDWRPVPLHQGIFINGKLEFYEDGNSSLPEETKQVGGKDIFALTIDALEEDKHVLIFESTRRYSELTAQKLSGILFRHFKFKNGDVASEILEENDGELSQKLADCVKMGAAFHHAGLLNSQRKIIEDAYKEGRIKAIVSTPTLAAGVNLPAGRVIIKSYYRFQNFSNQPIKVLEYKQMAGRAGRPGLDTRGESILVVKSKPEIERVIDRYIFGEPEDIRSKLGAENHLRFHTLSLVSEGYGRTVEDIENFFSSTFFFYQNEVSARYELEKIILQLDEWGMVEFDSEVINTTELGRLISILYIDPLTGHILSESLESPNSKFRDIDVLHLLCKTPDMENLYIKKSDGWVEEEIDNLGLGQDRMGLYHSESSFTPANYDWLLREVKTALLIHDWIEEVDEEEICERFSVYPGDIRRIVENAEWLSHSLSLLSNFFKHPERKKISKIEKRIKYGINEELVELASLRGIGRIRARKLYNAGIKNRKEILENRSSIPALIGKKMAEKVLNQI